MNEAAALLRIYRHPVKGLRPEALQHAELIENLGLKGDRAFALQFLDASVPDELRNAPAENAPWMPKFHLAVQHDWPALAQIIPTYNPENQSLTLSIDSPNAPSITDSCSESGGRMRLAQFVNDFLANEKPFAKARHATLSPLRLIGNVDLSTYFTDGSKGPLSIALIESIKDFEEKFGYSVDERRFRINLILCGAPAWSELKWSTRQLRIGSCIVQITKPIGRCANIDVDPDTGDHKNEVFNKMKEIFGHSFTGVRADVLRSGVIKPGDSWELL